MKNSPQPSEHAERPVRQADEQLAPAQTNQEQAVLDDLMHNGFVWEQAVKLLHMREHLYTNAEIRQRVASDQRMQFARWLYEQGELKE